jgi:dual specificity MAP kinase phosphatase
VIIAYLMKLRGWRLAESYKWVKDKRPNIKISEGELAVAAWSCRMGCAR